VPELAVYTVDAPVSLNGAQVPAHILAVAEPGQPLRLTAGESAVRLMVIGGEPLDAPRHMWWNFVSSRKERIVQAAQDWEAQRFDPVPGETEFIPLPPQRFKAD
jgi:redox-sensitive bicupin YhaK (pirin superfamily)